MPTQDRKLRPRIGANTPDFTDKDSVIWATIAVRDKYPTVEAALASPEWRALRPRVARFHLNKTASTDQEWALRYADIYIKGPGLIYRPYLYQKKALA